MATEHEIDRMVVRLVGNQDDYQKMLKDVERQTEESAKWAEERGSRITEAFNKAFRSAQGMMANIGSATQKAGMMSSGAGAAISAPLGKAAMDFSEYGKSIKDMVRETEKAAKEAEFMKRRLVENTEAYKELSKVVKLTTEQAQVFKLMSERTGISISELTKTIKVNSAEYEKWREEADKFGLVFDEESIKNANKLAESWLRVKEAMKGLWAQVGSAVAPAWKEFNDLIIGTVTWVVKWVKENKDLIATVGKVAEKLMIVGGALTAIGTAISTLSVTLGPVIALITAGAAAWLAWDTAAGKFLRGGATQAWEEYAEQVKGVVSKVMEYGRQIINHASKVMDGVLNAIKAGNLELAVEVLWAGVKVAWIRGLDEIDKLTGKQFSGIFQNLAAGNWKAAVEGLWIEIEIAWLKGANLVNKAWNIVEEGFQITVNELHKMWNNFMEFFERGIRSLLTGLGDLLNWITQNAGKIGAMISIGALIKGKGVAEATAMGVAAGVAANQLGSMGTEMVAALPVTEVRNAGELNKTLDDQLNQGRAARRDEGLEKERAIAQQIADLEQRRAQLAAEGKAEAKAKLKVEQETLNTQLEQAQAERDAAEEKAASDEATYRRYQELRTLQEQSLRIEQDRQAIVEQYDPVTKYMRQLKELNALFEESQRTTDVYKRALYDIREELKKESFKVDVEFGLTGMDAVRRATREEQQLIQNTLEMLGEKKAEEKALAEVQRREAEIAGEQTMAETTQEQRDQISITGQYIEPAILNPEIPSPEEIEELNNDPTNPFGTAGMNAARAEQLRVQAEQLQLQEEILGDPSNPFNMIGINGRTAREPVEVNSETVTKVEDKESLDRLNRVAIAVEKMADRDVVQLYPLSGVVA